MLSDSACPNFEGFVEQLRLCSELGMAYVVAWNLDNKLSGFTLGGKNPTTKTKSLEIFALLLENISHAGFFYFNVRMQWCLIVSPREIMLLIQIFFIMEVRNSTSIPGYSDIRCYCASKASRISSGHRSTSAAF